MHSIGKTNPICKSIPISDTIDFTGKRYFCPRSDRWDPRLWLHADKHRKDGPDAILAQEQLRQETKKNIKQYVLTNKEEKDRSIDREHQSSPIDEETRPRSRQEHNNGRLSSQDTSDDPLTTVLTKSEKSHPIETRGRFSDRMDHSSENKENERSAGNSVTASLVYAVPKGPVDGSIGFTGRGRTEIDPAKVAEAIQMRIRKAKQKQEMSGGGKKIMSMSNNTPTNNERDRETTDEEPREPTTPREDRDAHTHKSKHNPNARHGERRQFVIFKSSAARETDWKGAREKQWQETLNEEQQLEKELKEKDKDSRPVTDEPRTVEEAMLKPKIKPVEEGHFEEDKTLVEEPEPKTKKPVPSINDFKDPANIIDTSTWTTSAVANPPVTTKNSNQMSLEALKAATASRKMRANEKEKINSALIHKETRDNSLKKLTKERDIKEKPQMNKYTNSTHRDREQRREYLPPHARSNFDADRALAQKLGRQVRKENENLQLDRENYEREKRERQFREIRERQERNERERDERLKRQRESERNIVEIESPAHFFDPAREKNQESDRRPETREQSIFSENIFSQAPHLSYKSGPSHVIIDDKIDIISNSKSNSKRSSKANSIHSSDYDINILNRSSGASSGAQLSQQSITKQLGQSNSKHSSREKEKKPNKKKKKDKENKNKSQKSSKLDDDKEPEWLDDGDIDINENFQFEMMPNDFRGDPAIVNSERIVVGQKTSQLNLQKMQMEKDKEKPREKKQPEKLINQFRGVGCLQ